MADSTTTAFQSLRHVQQKAERLAEDINTAVETLGDAAPEGAEQMLIRAERHSAALASEQAELRRVARFAELLDGQVRQRRRQRQR